jgi:hypothetical protein
MKISINKMASILNRKQTTNVSQDYKLNFKGRELLYLINREVSLLDLQ